MTGELNVQRIEYSQRFNHLRIKTDKFHITVGPKGVVVQSVDGNEKSRFSVTVQETLIRTYIEQANLTGTNTRTTNESVYELQIQERLQVNQ